MSALVASDVPEVQAAIRRQPCLLAVGAGTKPALSSPPPGRDVTVLDVSRLTGIVDYDPGDLTFVARGGTPLAEIEALLSERGQYLPFDPPLRAAGATLAGAVAAGVSGPGAFGGGGLRDFVIGVRFVDGTGRLAAGGGRVVKNAAGFDLPKLMVGSLGRLGVIVELACKVFPRPPATATLAFQLDGLAAALEAIAALGRGPVAIAALDLEPPARLLVRLSGDAELLDARCGRVEAMLGAPAERLRDAAERSFWEAAAEFDWAPSGSSPAVVPIAPAAVSGLDAALEEIGCRRRYGLGANVAWVACPSEPDIRRLDRILLERGLSGTRLSGAAGDSPLLGVTQAGAFGARVARALDPERRFAELVA